MKQHKRVFVPLLATLVLLWALACGGSSTAPAAMSDVPVYPGVTSAEIGDNAIADLMVEEMKKALATQEGATVDFDMYTLPADATWDAVKSFYDAELADTDWKPAEELSQEAEGVYVTGWQRGALASQQALAIIYVPDLFGGGSASLIVMLASE